MNAQFGIGDTVRVRQAYPPGHVRAPYFTRGKTGIVDTIAGAYRNPEELAYGRYEGKALPLYRVLFRQTDLWPDYDGPAADTTIVDVYENWLEPVEGGQK
jgi:Nitrile hydratase beta subunit, C-terminal